MIISRTSYVRSVPIASVIFIIGLCHAVAGAQTRAAVKSSFLQKDCTSATQGNSICGLLLHIRADIEGHDLELIAEGRPYTKWANTALIVPGEYEVSRTRNETTRPYLLDQAYDFTFANGDKQHFIVVGIFTK